MSEFCVSQCDGITESKIVRCDNCKKDFHEDCLKENGMEPEDLSDCGYSFFENKTSVIFCSISCMISLLTRVMNGHYSQLKAEEVITENNEERLEENYSRINGSKGTRGPQIGGYKRDLWYYDDWGSQSTDGKK